MRFIYSNNDYFLPDLYTYLLRGIENMDRIRRLGRINGKGQETIVSSSGLVDWKEMVKRERKDTTSSSPAKRKFFFYSHTLICMVCEVKKDIIAQIILNIPTLLPPYAFNFRGISFCGSDGLIPPLFFLLSSHLNNGTVL